MPDNVLQPLTDDALAKMEKRANAAGLGYDTADLARHYARDVRVLIRDREEVQKLRQQDAVRLAAYDDLQARCREVDGRLRALLGLSAEATAEEMFAEVTRMVEAQRVSVTLNKGSHKDLLTLAANGPPLGVINAPATTRVQDVHPALDLANEDADE